MAATPTSYTSLTSLIQGPATEQMSLQEEANQLLSLIESAHAIVGAISDGEKPSAGQSSMTLGTALHTCRERMAALNDRLGDLSRYIGAV